MGAYSVVTAGQKRTFRTRDYYKTVLTFKNI